MSFQDLAALLLPADADGTICEAGSDWGLDPAALTTGRASVWGREPTWTPAGGELLRYGARRERALARLRARPPGGLSVVGVHRWSYDFVRPRRLPRTLLRLRSGLLVELTSDPALPRVIDRVASAAGLTGRVDRPHFGSGGQISACGRLASGAPVVLRVAPAGSPVEPSHAATALARLEPFSLPEVPRPLASGRTATTVWSTETRLPGHPAPSITPALVSAVADFCVRLPRDPSAPSAFASDIERLIDRLPRFRTALRDLEARAAPAIARLPSVFRHGDLWRGNVLVRDGELTGVVDWDAWHPAGVPGTDLLHFVASTRAFAARRSFGQLMGERPWEDPLFTAAATGYWSRLGVTPDAHTLEAVGVAWWTTQTMANLQRHPYAAASGRWLETSVESLLGAAR